jgi:hypothetical protein
MCLISEEHAKKLVWTDDVAGSESEGDLEEEDETDERVADFSVEKTQNQVDGASLREGFLVRGV